MSPRTQNSFLWPHQRPPSPPSLALPDTWLCSHEGLDLMPLTRRPPSLFVAFPERLHVQWLQADPEAGCPGVRLRRVLAPNVSEPRFLHLPRGVIMVPTSSGRQTSSDLEPHTLPPFLLPVLNAGARECILCGGVKCSEGLGDVIAWRSPGQPGT